MVGLIDPEDSILKASLEKYAKRGYTQEEKITQLGLDHPGMTIRYF